MNKKTLLLGAGLGTLAGSAGVGGALIAVSMQSSSKVGDIKKLKFEIEKLKIQSKEQRLKLQKVLRDYFDAELDKLLQKIFNLEYNLEKLNIDFEKQGQHFDVEILKNQDEIQKLFDKLEVEITKKELFKTSIYNAKNQLLGKIHTNRQAQGKLNNEFRHKIAVLSKLVKMLLKDKWMDQISKLATIKSQLSTAQRKEMASTISKMEASVNNLLSIIKNLK